MATTSRLNISSKFENNDIPTAEHFGQIIESFVHKDEDKADLQMVETGTDNEHYVTPELLRIGLQNIGIITGNSYMPKKEYFESSFNGTTLSLEKLPIQYSVKVYKNGQLLQEDQDYTVNYETAVITFSDQVSDRNIEIDYWFKNLSPNPTPGGGSQPIDLTSFLHTSGNETKNGILTFNNTTAASTSGIALTNSGSGVASASLNVNVNGAGKGISLENSSNGTGVYLNSTAEATGDILQVAKNNVVKVKIDNEGNVTAKKFVTSAGLRSEFVKGDGFLDPTVYAEDSEVLHRTGDESKDGALTLTNSIQQDVLTIEKSNDANCLKLVQNSNSDATTSTWDTSTANAGRKAISIQKQGDETAFITHDGDVTAHSFSTTKADLTDDGLLSLENRPSPEASEGKAKLYAKTDGTTDMYVMGSDGIEKKIGGEVDLSGKENTIAPGTTAQYYRGDKSWQTLDKTAVGLPNVDNTSDLNKPVSTAMQTALNGKATDTNVIHTTGNESFTGYKSATNFPSLSGILLTNASGASTSVLSVTNNSSTAAVSIDSNSDGAALLVRTNSSLGGTALKIEASFPSTGKALLFAKTGVDTTWISNNGDFTAPKLIKSGGTSSQYLMADGSTSSSEPSQITITTSVSITTDTLDANSKKQIGKNVVINNGSSAINITVNGGTDFSASYLKIGTGAITFVQGSGRTLVQVDGSALFNGVPGSTATISSVGTVDYLRISNA